MSSYILTPVQIMAKSLALVVNKIDHIKIIDHKFHESGHTRTEYNSMHATIEVSRNGREKQILPC